LSRCFRRILDWLSIYDIASSDLEALEAIKLANRHILLNRASEADSMTLPDP